MSTATEELTDYLNNPQPGGCYMVEIIEGSTLHKAGLRGGDMIYEIDGHRLDIYGEMSVEWSEDKIFVLDYISRLQIGQEVHLVVYRQGERMELSVTVTQQDLPAIRFVHPGYEPIDYELFGGMVVMQLTNNHINLLANQCLGLFRYLKMTEQSKPVLLITHIFHNSTLHMSRTLYPGVTISEINGMPVETLDDFRQAIKQNAKSEYFRIKGSDNASGATDNLLVVLSMEKILREEPILAQAYQYMLSPLVQEVLELRALR